MGIREMDLEPQLQGNKILIPRISEFAAVMVVQAMRTTTARMRFGPSDQIFSSTDAQSEVTLSNTSVPTPEQIHIPKTLNEEPTHPAEIIPLTMERHLPLLDKYTIIDTITASAALESYAVEVDKSQEYQNLIDALQKEIRFKAFRRGAAGVISFRLQITPLTSPSRYRITAMGLAIKSR
jgi:hypothetical protein